MTNVLLAEDDSELMVLYRRQLIASGFRVFLAYNGSEIEKIVNVYNIDVIVSDTNLPKQDGDIACGRLSQKGKLDGILVIGMSFNRNYDRERRGFAHDFLYKGGICDLGETVKSIYSRFIDDQKNKEK